MKTATQPETTKIETRLTAIEKLEQALARRLANKTAADAELDAKAAESDRLDAELETELAEFDKDTAEDTPEDTPTAPLVMACDHACDKCGNCPDRHPQSVEDENLIALLTTPCDCEVLNVEVKHVPVNPQAA